MSANLINKQSLLKPVWPEPKPTTPKPNRIRVSLPVVNRLEQAEPIRRDSISQVKHDEEVRFVTRALIWMALLAMAPLILFYVVTLFYPDIFMISVSP